MRSEVVFQIERRYVAKFAAGWPRKKKSLFVSLCTCVCIFVEVILTKEQNMMMMMMMFCLDKEAFATLWKGLRLTKKSQA